MNKINEQRDNLSFPLDSNIVYRNPILANSLLSRIERMKNEGTQLQYNNISTTSRTKLNAKPSSEEINVFFKSAEESTKKTPDTTTLSPIGHNESDINMSLSSKNKDLLTEISQWYSKEDLDSKPFILLSNITKKACWEVLASNHDGTSFCQFLRKLRECYVAKSAPEFNQHIKAFLDKIVVTPSVAGTLFAIASDGTTDCNDRALFNYNLMQQAFIIEDIDMGAYDTTFEKFILLARSIYRIEQLNNMANIYMKRYPHKDEIEVYLSFQTKLHQDLDLRHIAPDMNSVICASISKADLILAEIKVKQNENIEFSAWLSQWEPLHRLIGRLTPEKMHAAKEKKYNALEYLYPELVDDMLKKNTLKNIPDTEINAGKIVFEKIQLEINQALMKDFFSERQIIDLIDKKVWPTN